MRKGLETDVTSWLYRGENEELADIPKQMYLKASTMVDKMGYKGYGLGPEEKGIKLPISPISYKYNRGFDFFPKPKIAIVSAQTKPPAKVKDFDEEELNEMPFEYLNDIFHDAHVKIVTPVAPPNSYKLKLVHPKLIERDQSGPPILDIYVDDSALIVLLNIQDLENDTFVNVIQLLPEAYFGSQVNSLSRKSENKKKNQKSPSENLSEAPSNIEKLKIKDMSSSENLEQALEDEGIDLPTMVPLQQEKSPLLIKETDTINMGTEETPKNVLIAKSLTD